MIKANELRIGNLVIGYDDKIIKWGLKECSFLEADIYLDEIVKSPIPLTDDWLEDLGFKEEIGNVWHVLDWFFSLKKIKGKYLLVEFRHIEITSVHQLQNLYFALTGTELNAQQPK